MGRAAYGQPIYGAPACSKRSAWSRCLLGAHLAAMGGSVITRLRHHTGKGSQATGRPAMASGAKACRPGAVLAEAERATYGEPMARVGVRVRVGVRACHLRRTYGEPIYAQRRQAPSHLRTAALRQPSGLRSKACAPLGPCVGLQMRTLTLTLGSPCPTWSSLPRSTPSRSSARPSGSRSRRRRQQQPTEWPTPRLA